jgi:ClpP class serine protease
MDKLGITAKAITSGPLKDMASPFKPLDAADQKILQVLVPAAVPVSVDGRRRAGGGRIAAG